MSDRIPYVVGVIAFVVLLIIVISLGLFDFWVFFGMIFYIILYIVGFFYIFHGWKSDREEDIKSVQRKAKFDYCLSRINMILKQMPGGEGVEWDRGFGRVSDFRSFSDGVQSKPFRSILGYISGTQQLVLIIYDIEGDDIVKFEANPSPDTISNHFLNFNPYKSGGLDGFRSSMGGYGYPYSSYARRTGRRPPMSIHIGDDGFDAPQVDVRRTNPDRKVVDSAMDKLTKG